MRETIMNKFCTKCGHELKQDQLFCPSCGTKSESIVKETANVALDNPGTSATNASTTSFNGGTPKKKNHFPKVAAIIGLVAVVVVVVIVYILFIRNSYKDPLERYTNGVNNLNVRMVQKAFSPVIAYDEHHFNNIDSADMADRFDGLTVNLSVEEEHHMDKSEIDEYFNDVHNLTYIPKTMPIQDSYLVKLELNIKQGDKTDKKIFQAVPIVKLEGVWYIADTQLLDFDF